MISGRTELLAAVTVISVVAASTDVLKGRIYNWLTLPALLVGLAIGAWSGGWRGLGDAALGSAAGLAFYGWMFALGMMGGGDVKLLMALGAWGGFYFAEEVALLSILLGGVCAVIWLAAKGKLVAFLAKVRRLAVSVTVKELELDVPQLDRSLTMPFGIPIAAAAIWSAHSHPLVAWGFKPWP